MAAARKELKKTKDEGRREALQKLLQRMTEQKKSQEDKDARRAVKSKRNKVGRLSRSSRFCPIASAVVHVYTVRMHHLVHMHTVGTRHQRSKCTHFECHVRSTEMPSDCVTSLARLLVMLTHWGGNTTTHVRKY
jgi:hypothetical protein